MSKITCIIPTLWIPTEIKESCIELNNSPVVKQVIIIDNNSANRTVDFSSFGTKEYSKYLYIHKEKVLVEKFGKFLVIVPPKNIYVSKSWNIGAKLAEAEILCILNDDLVVHNSVLESISKYLDNSIGIIGITTDHLNDNIIKTEILSFSEVKSRPLCFGCCMFLLKENYIQIPENIKIWYNDDWLFAKVPGKKLIIHGGKIRGKQSVSVNSSNPEIQSIIQQDTIQWNSLCLQIAL